MDDTLEKEVPKARAKPAKGTSRKSPTDAPAAKPRTRSAPAKTEQDKAPPKVAARRKVTVEEEKTAKLAPARKGKAAVAPLSVETQPAAKKPRAPAKARQPKQKESASAPAVPAQAKTPHPEPLSPAPAEVPSAKTHGDGRAGDVTIHPVEPHVPNIHPHDEGLEFGLSPVDLAPDAGVREEGGLGWFVRTLALSSVLLVLFNSFAIDKWSREQPVTPFNSRILIAAHQLHGEMRSFHFDAPLEGMRSIWHGIRDARWPGSAESRDKTVTGNPSAN